MTMNFLCWLPYVLLAIVAVAFLLWKVIKKRNPYI